MLPLNSRRVAALSQGVPVRTLDVAGPELVTNGLFAADVSGWTDASSAGGAISWNSGKLRTTYTTGTARARQAVSPVEVGARYWFFGQMVAGTVNGTVAIGSTTPGSNDYLSTTTQVALAARAGVIELTATSTTVQIGLNTGVAGYGEWDNVTLRKLTPTKFRAGKWFVDDFSVKPDGPMGVTPDGLAWRQMPPANSNHVYPSVSGGKLTMATSGAAISASYSYLHLGDGKATAIYCDVGWTGVGASVAMISLAPTATVPTMTNITTNSVHIVFTDTKVDIQTYVAGVLTSETVTYSAAVARDGTVYSGVGWSLNGNTLTVTLPDGSTVQRTDAKFAQVAGSVGIIEHFYGSGVTGTSAISKASVRLG